MDTVDRVSVQLELAHDSGREVNPTGVQFGKADRLTAGPAQSLEHSPLLGVSERHRLDCRGVQGLNFHLVRRLGDTYRIASNVSKTTALICCGGHGQPPLCSSDRRRHPESEKSTELTERTKQFIAFRSGDWDFSSPPRMGVGRVGRFSGLPGLAAKTGEKWRGDERVQQMSYLDYR